MRDLNLEALRKIAAYPLELSVERYLDWLVPPFSEGVQPNFWDTQAGELLAQAQWTLYADEAMTIAEAARLVRDSADGADIMYIKDNIPLYRRPKSAFKSHRAGATSTSRAWYVRRQHVMLLMDAINR